jgi:hypothetical protein
MNRTADKTYCSLKETAGNAENTQKQNKIETNA